MDAFKILRDSGGVSSRLRHTGILTVAVEGAAATFPTGTLRGRNEITVAVCPPIHPDWLRCSSLTCLRACALLAPRHSGDSTVIFATVISLRPLNTALQWRTEGHSLPFATVLIASGEVIGSTRFGNIEFAHKRAEIGWTWLAAAHHNSGANTEAKYLMLRHAFEHWGLNRVELKTDVLNEKSRRAIAALGAQQEGIMRRHIVNEGGRVRDSVFFSLIAEEWPRVKAALEIKMARRGGGIPPD